MACFMTGSTGFIGRHLLGCLLERGETVYCLVRQNSLDKLQESALRNQKSPGRVVPVVGDLELPRLGLEHEQVQDLQGRIAHFFHLAALYDLTADSQTLARANVEGTRHALELADALEVGCFHHVSSIAVAGRYAGTFTEDMLEEAGALDEPYAATKHDAELLVRRECQRPYRIYRPAVVVGHSETGEIDKIDGPYFLFRSIQRVRDAVPEWLPRIGFAGGTLNLVPVDYVANAIDYISHAKDLDGRTFHLVEPHPKSAGETFDEFCRAARAPASTVQLPLRDVPRGVSTVIDWLERVPGVRRASDDVLAELGIPRQVLRHAVHSTRYGCEETTSALAGSGIEVPPLASYAGRLWDFWELNLASAPARNPRLARAVENKRVLIAGAAGAIGRATALRLAASGATVLLVARDRDRLDALRKEIEQTGGKATAYAADLARAKDCDALVKQVLAAHGGIDVLVNDAARGASAGESFVDFERAMQLQYFAPLKLILGFLPAMRQHGSGQILQLTSSGSLAEPRAAASAAAEAALEAFCSAAAAELAEQQIVLTKLELPSLRSGAENGDASAAAGLYRNLRTVTPERAAGTICDAIVRRPQRVRSLLGITAQVADAAAPSLYQGVRSLVSRWLPAQNGAETAAETEH